MGRPLTDRDIEDINEGFKDMSRETLINTIIFFAVFFYSSACTSTLNFCFNELSSINTYS